MGLDMYLEARKYLVNYDDSTEVEKEKFETISKLSGFHGNKCDGLPTLTVCITVAYWRKANHIHKWFVDNVQDGEDDCRSAFVTIKQLHQLVNKCKEVMKEKEKASELLPTADGFFFGSQEIDENYYLDIEDTIKQIEPLLNNENFKKASFFYRSSW